MRKTLTTLCSVAALCAGLSVTSATAEDNLKFTVLTQTGIDNTFWQTIKRGMDDACEDYQVDCQLLFTAENGNLQMHLQNLETTISQGVDGIATVIVDDNLYDDAIARAVEGGIPVVTINVDDTKGADGNARLAFIGQDLFQAGYEVAKGLLEGMDKSQTQHVLLALARPGESWAEDRIGGARLYLDEAIAAGWNLTHETIDSSNDISVTGQRICQYVLGNPNTTAVVGSAFWFAGAGECLRDMGVKAGEIHMGGFDLVPILLDEMKLGYVDLTVDQQPYLQGYLPIQQLYFVNKFGLSTFDVNTGKALIRLEDVATVEEYSAQGVR